MRKGTTMNTLKVMILICSANLSPADCQTDTAFDVISGPEVSSLVACGLQGQSQLAATTIGRIRPDEYVKIRCEPVGRIAAKPMKSPQHREGSSLSAGGAGVPD
jgi:hypothetical protein